MHLRWLFCSQTGEKYNTGTLINFFLLHLTSGNMGINFTWELTSPGQQPIVGNQKNV